MNCPHVDKYIYEYCAANLSPDVYLQIEKHLKQCEACTNLLQLTLMENDVLKELDTPTLDDNFTSRVMAAISADSQPALDNIQIIKPARSKKPYLYLVPVAVIVLLLTAVAPELYNSFDNSSDKNPGKLEMAVKDSADKKLMIDQSSDSIETEESGNTQSEATIYDGYEIAGQTNNSPDSDTAADNNNSNSNPAAVSPQLPVQIAMINDAAVPEVPDAQMLQENISDYTEYGINDLHMAAQSYAPNRFRSYTVSLPAPLEEVSVMPVNLPDNYILNLSSDTGYAANFIFTETNTNQTVEITVEPYSVTNSNLSATADGGQNEQLLEVIAKYEKNQYLIRLKSSLSNEELLKLASAIKLSQSGQ